MSRTSHVLVFVASVSSAFGARAADQVEVLNFPREQQVSGTVSVKQPVEVVGHLDTTRLVTFEDVLALPLRSGGVDDTREMADLGVLDVKGFPTAVFSAAGSFSGQVANAGTVVLVLVPDVAFVRKVNDDQGVALLATTVTVTVTRRGATYFEGASAPVSLRFPRYRVFLHADGGPALRANVYVSLQD